MPRGIAKPLPSRTGRRSLLRAGLAGAAAWGLCACGFQLRRPPQLALRRIHFKGFAMRSPMADELRRQLRVFPEVQISETAADGQVVLVALTDRREQVVAASSATGLISEVTLRTRLRFQVLSPDGKELIAPTELLLAQDMSFAESSAMAKEHEAELLYRAMQQDIALQVLRRLAALPGY